MPAVTLAPAATSRLPFSLSGPLPSSRFHYSHGGLLPQQRHLGVSPSAALAAAAEATRVCSLASVIWPARVLRSPAMSASPHHLSGPSAPEPREMLSFTDSEASLDKLEDSPPLVPKGKGKALLQERGHPHACRHPRRGGFMADARRAHMPRRLPSPPTVVPSSSTCPTPFSPSTLGLLVDVDDFHIVQSRHL
jgi:hypothetical protein